MAGDPEVLSVLAQALTYPDEATSTLVARCADAARWAPPDATGPLAGYAARFEGLTLAAMQEQFVGAFDFDPKCSLDIGWHLHGDNYDRGDFLVRMRELLAGHGIDEGPELPDHLPHLLRLLARMPSEPAARLATESVVPAVDKILDGLSAHDGPYLPLMRGVRAVVSALTARDVDEVSHV